MPTVFKFIIVATGAFVCWMFKGFKGEFNDEMVGPYDFSSGKSTRNFLLGTIVIGLLLFILIKYYENSQPTPEVIILNEEFKSIN